LKQFSGDYLIVEPFPEKISRGKIKAQVAHVLLPEHIAFLKNQALWFAILNF
jgi:peptidyl-tRNA hydrolase